MWSCRKKGVRRCRHDVFSLNNDTDVAPALHVSTTYRYADNPDELMPEHELPKPETTNFPPVYSRESAPNTTRLEAVLSSLLRGLAAFHAIIVYLRPNVVAIGQNRVGGYHGYHGVLALHTKMHGLKLADLHDDLGKGDVVHIETPLNPYREAYNIKAFAEKAHKQGAYLTIDSTFRPPGLQDPLALSADVVMHSGTKYIGGHSGMLCGVLAVSKERESYLPQSRNTELLVNWLHSSLTSATTACSPIELAARQVVDKILRTQMPNGFGPVFALWMKTEEDARQLPSKLRLFHHATSLGGVESLVEWRRMSDERIDATLLRFSIGVENWEDLRDDMAMAFLALAKSR
ncbi:pyridoxal phosphate-dependent transferase [Plectosphaerella plurivora]|uniref:Pyridoxal phosphate-dependent transferase n=1 Tax=Plectosphaerella plurivora TaxID=936078 RepID=A0A9P8V957_9PEZI|nr:pyridoxal phosphate-dependent transferase [Plectosphaerella plurivora]